jgi:hypothetical protein
MPKPRTSNRSASFKADQRVLGGVIGAATGERQPAAHRSDVHDAPLPGAAHAGQHELRQAQQAEHVGVELPAQGVDRHFLERSRLAEPGVVDQRAHAAMVPFDDGHRASHRIFIGHVERQRPGAGLPQGVEHVGTPRGGVDGPARVRQPRRNRRADSGRTAGDKN